MRNVILLGFAPKETVYFINNTLFSSYDDPSSVKAKTVDVRKNQTSTKLKEECV